MKFYLKSTVFPVIIICMLLLMSCDNSDTEPNPESEPYFNIHMSPLYKREYWFIVTNGAGEIVGHKKVGSQGAEIAMTERQAEINGYINLYYVVVRDENNGSTNKRFYISAELGIEPGGHFNYILSDPANNSEDIDINVYNVPDPFSTLLAYGTGGSTYRIDHNSDNIQDTVALHQSITAGRSENILSVYNPESPKYTIVHPQPGMLHEFNYPDDFSSYDHEIEVEITDPDYVYIQGFQDNEVANLLLYSRGIEDLGTFTSMKFCYLNGYDSYYTAYRAGLKTYYKTGGIPTAESLQIPDRTITVTNSSLTSFLASYPAEIDYRASIYHGAEAKGDSTYIYELTVSAASNGIAKFDLEHLPAEFINAYKDIDFSLLEYKSTQFTDSKSANAHDDFVKKYSRSPDDGPVEIETHTYTVPK